VQEVTKEIAESFKLRAAGGVLITQVERGGPADKAGVQAGDVLSAVNGKPVADTIAMLNSIATLQPGDEARLRVSRNQAEQELSVTIGRRPRPPARKG
jgi:serine protease DegQ